MRRDIAQGCADFLVFREDPSTILNIVRGNINAVTTVFVTGSQMRLSRNFEITSHDHNFRTLKTTFTKTLIMEPVQNMVVKINTTRQYQEDILF